MRVEFGTVCHLPIILPSKALRAFAIAHELTVWFINPKVAGCNFELLVVYLYKDLIKLAELIGCAGGLKRNVGIGQRCCEHEVGRNLAVELQVER